MNIYMIALGTRGDVQPYIGLGIGLQKAGHRVTICSSANFRSFVEEYGIQFEPTRDDLLAVMNTDDGQAILDNSVSFFKKIRIYMQVAKQSGAVQMEMLEDTWRAAEKSNPDVILYHPKGYGAPHFAEKLGVPVIHAFLAPGVIPTQDFPAFGFPTWKLGGWYNRWTTRVVLKALAMSLGKYIKSWRSLHGLPALPQGVSFSHLPSGEPIPMLLGFSEHVVPRPSDWPKDTGIMGYWFLPQPDAWTPPASLVDFLNSGPAPVYVGFGSMSSSKSAQVSRIVVEALQKANVRAVLAKGWGGLKVGDVPDSIHLIDAAPHDWLFPRMAAVVHHGGAGTTSAGLRAGKPTLICPFFGDQPFWGQRIKDLGAGPAPIAQKDLKVDNLAAALQDLVTNETYRRTAEDIGHKLQNEDSLTRTIAFIERHAKTRRG